MITLSILLLYTIYNKKKASVFALVTIVLLAICIIWSPGLIFRTSLEPDNIFQDNIVGLGAILGFNIFVLILSMIGLISSWKNKKQYVWIYLLLVVLVLFSYYFDSEFKIILNMFVSLFAFYGLLALIKMNWELKLVRTLTIVILVVGILFSSFSFMYRISFMEPNLGMIDALDKLRFDSNVGDIVLSHYKNGFWIQYFSQRPTVIDSYTPPDAVFNDTNTLFKTRDEEMATELLHKYNIKYIFVDDKTLRLMKNDQNLIGLRFLMENSKNFRLHDSDGFEIWEFSEEPVESPVSQTQLYP